VKDAGPWLNREMDAISKAESKPRMNTNGHESKRNEFATQKTDLGSDRQFMTSSPNQIRVQSWLMN
jgi:hypothetical protein